MVITTCVSLCTWHPAAPYIVVCLTVRLTALNRGCDGVDAFSRVCCVMRYTSWTRHKDCRAMNVCVYTGRYVTFYKHFLILTKALHLSFTDTISMYLSKSLIIIKHIKIHPSNKYKQFIFHHTRNYPPNAASLLILLPL